MSLYELLQQERRLNNELLPLRSIEQLITARNVDSFFRDRKVSCDGQLEDNILRNRKQLFAILILCKRGELIQSVLDNDITDEDLPFRSTKNIPKVIGNPDQIGDFYEMQRVCPPRLTCCSEPKCVLQPPFGKDERPAALGGFGKIYKIKVAKEHLFDHDPNEYMAWKKISTRYQPWDVLKREVSTLIKRKHEHIVPLLACFEMPPFRGSSGHLNLLFPWADLDMRRWMKKAENGSAVMSYDNDPQLRKTYIYDTVLSLMSAVAYLHRDIGGEITSHHDLKPENILLFGKTWKICDLGKTHFKHIASGSETDSRLGTRDYQPPEYGVETSHGRAFDIWAMGCIFIELAIVMVFGRDKGNFETFEERMKNNKVRPEKFGKDDSSFRNNMEVVSEYMNHLESKDGSVNFRCLMETTRTMLSNDRNERPYSWEVYLNLYDHFKPDNLGSERDNRMADFVQPPQGRDIYRSHNPLSDAIMKKDKSRVEWLQKKGWSLPGFDDKAGDIVAFEEAMRILTFQPSPSQITQIFTLSCQRNEYWQATINDEDEEDRRLRNERITRRFTKILVGLKLTFADIKRLLDQRHPVDLMKIFVGEMNVNYKFGDGTSAIFWAAWAQDVPAVDVLIQYGSELNPINHLRETPLMVAAKLGHWPVVERLLQEKSVNVNHQDNHLRTSLSWAAQFGRHRVAELLLNHGDNETEFELAGQYGRTPLSLAAGGGHKEIFDMLHDKGANPKKKDRDGHSPLVHAKAEIEHRRWKGESELHDHEQIVRTLEQLDRADDLEVKRVLSKRNGDDPR